jgi:CubicO group peptidase (beta-lactamase class C family)
MSASYENIKNHLFKQGVSKELPAWQSKLIAQIVFCLKTHYISYDELSNNLLEQLNNRFASQFAQLDSEQEIIEEYKKTINLTNPALFLTEFKAEAMDRKTRLEIVQKEIAARGITGDAILLNGEGLEKSIYVVKNGKVLEDNLFKGMPLANIKIPEYMLGLTGKLKNSDENDALIEEAIARTAYTHFAEGTMNALLEDLTRDLHLSFMYSPDSIMQNSSYLKEQKAFPPQPLSNLAKDNFGFYQDTGEAKTEIPTNIGYFRLSRIYDPSKDIRIKETAFALMREMQEKDAIILDVRNTGGGTPEGVQYLLSFFFENPTHLNTVHMRDKENKYTTLPLSQLNPNTEEIVDLSKKPVYILVGAGTFSAAEELAYDMQQLGRGTIVGERTRGGAHPCEMKPLLDPNSVETVEFNPKFCLIVPNATSINPYSHTNWEDGPKKMGKPPGVQPDKPVLQDALQETITEINDVFAPHMSQTTLAEIQKITHIPGISTAAFSHRAMTRQSVGITHADNPQEVTSETVFEAASLSKPVLAYLVLRLAQQKIIHLDRPLYEYSDFDFPPHIKEHAHYKKLTARMILSHQAGFPNEALEFITTPGETFDYSGEAYRFLGFILEKMTNKSVEDLAQDEFKKMGMNHSSFMPPSGCSFIKLPDDTPPTSETVQKLLKDTADKNGGQLSVLYYQGNIFIAERQADGQMQITEKNLSQDPRSLDLIKKRFAEIPEFLLSKPIPIEAREISLVTKIVGHSPQYAATIATGHFSDGAVNLSQRFYGVHPAGSLYTTASDYVKFLKACTHDPYIREEMFKPTVPSLKGKDTKAMEQGVSDDVLDQMSWGMGIGMQNNADGSCVAFHWGDIGTGTNLATINLETDEAVVCLTNSTNGPRAFRAIAEPIVGDLSVISDWLTKREGLPMAEKISVKQRLKDQKDTQEPQKNSDNSMGYSQIVIK